MLFHMGSEGVLFQMLRQDEAWQVGPLFRLIFFFLVQTNAGENFHGADSALLLRGLPPASAAGGGQRLPGD